MTKYVWTDPGGKVTVMLACVTLIAVMVFIDGLMKGELLRAAAGAIVAWPFATFTFRGIPIPEAAARRAGKAMRSVTSTRAGAASEPFRWAMVVLGVLLGLAALAGAVMMMSASAETIELFVPSVARGIVRARASDAEMLERLGYAALFAVAAGALLLTAWKRVKG